ncbi:MAG TPA: glycosyltransferase 87 family protein [Egibacteraceae bacterium]|nr:glycosyltransferase 87 family protein [Egibacteraceae bacterium]
MRPLDRERPSAPHEPPPGDGAASDPSIGLITASLLVSLAIVIRLGPWDLVALGFVLVATAIAIWATFRPVMMSSPQHLRALACGAFLVQGAVWLAMLSPAAAAVADQRAIIAIGAIAAAAALVLGWDVLRPRPRIRWAVPAFVAAVGVVGVIATLPLSTGIDVLMFQEISADRLLAGENPYAGDFPDPYSPANSARVYGPGVAVDGVLKFGYPYPPLTLLLVLPGALLGDVRVAQLAAVLAAGWLMATLRGGSWRARTGAALFLTSPAIFFVTARGWTEPFLIALLVAMVWSYLRRSRWSDVILGLFTVSKQYVVLLAPLYLLLIQRPWTWRSIAPTALRAAVVGSAVTLPFALWDLQAFWWSVVELQFRQPFRPDALSLLAVAVNATGWPPPSTFAWLPLVAGVAALAAALRWAPRSATGMAAGSAIVMLAFLLMSKQAFTNYYFFAIGALTLAVAASEGADAGHPASYGASS